MRFEWLQNGAGTGRTNVILAKVDFFYHQENSQGYRLKTIRPHVNDPSVFFFYHSISKQTRGFHRNPKSRFHYDIISLTSHRSNANI